MFKKLYYNKSFAPYKLFIESFFALWAVCRACHITTKSFLAPILFGAFFLSFRYIFKLKAEKPEVFTDRHNIPYIAKVLDTGEDT